MLDYYEFLQISSNAEVDTIHRVYKFLAARFHPDNQSSGNPEQFRLLKTAYDERSCSRPAIQPAGAPRRFGRLSQDQSGTARERARAVS